MSISNIWFEVFNRISRVDGPVVVYFWLSTGAEFFMVAPKRHEIERNGFSEHLKFEHFLDEIDRIKFFEKVGGGKHEISNPVSYLGEILGDIDGIQLEMSDDGLLTSLKQS